MEASIQNLNIIGTKLLDKYGLDSDLGETKDISGGLLLWKIPN